MTAHNRDSQMKKIYLSGSNLCGKGFLYQLLDGHPNLVLAPYHKFTVSSIAEAIFTEFEKPQSPVVGGYYNVSNAVSINLIHPISESVIQLDSGRLVHFLISRIPTMPYLIHASLTGKTIAYSGDQKKTETSFKFDFVRFFSSLIEQLSEVKNHPVTVDDLENFLFWAFKEGHPKQSSESNLSLVAYADNGPLAISNLFDYFPNPKVLVMVRDPLNVAFAQALRTLSEQNSIEDTHSIFSLMRASKINSCKKQSAIANALANCVNTKKGIMAINFEDLFTDRVGSMKKIAEFLGIDFSDVLLTPSINGYPVPFNEIVDIPSDILSTTHLCRLEQLFGRPWTQTTPMSRYSLIWDKAISGIAYLYSTGFWRIWNHNSG